MDPPHTNTWRVENHLHSGWPGFYGQRRQPLGVLSAPIAANKQVKAWILA